MHAEARAAGIEAGTYGTVVGTNPAMNLLSVEQPSGNVVTYDPRRLDRRQCLPRSGARILRRATRFSSQRPTNRSASPTATSQLSNQSDPMDHISARLDNGRQIELNALAHRHFDHGYAVTSHSSQGLTAERVLVNADTGVHPDLLNSRFGYVSISRASHEATLFTNDLSRLSPQMSVDKSKTSALEINQAPSFSHGVGMGI